jgi:hypothetical protein
MAQTRRIGKHNEKGVPTKRAEVFRPTVVGKINADRSLRPLALSRVGSLS